MSVDYVDAGDVMAHLTAIVNHKTCFAHVGNRISKAEVFAWVNTHISDQQLNSELLAKEMNYGRSVFFRKVKAVTGKTPNEYIRDLRMAKAVELLQDDTLTIQQVAHALGIEEGNYFARIFKQYYGIAPSAWRKGDKGNSPDL